MPTARLDLLKPTVPSDWHGLQVTATLSSHSVCFACRTRRVPLEITIVPTRTHAPVCLFCSRTSTSIKRLTYCSGTPCHPPFSSPVSHSTVVLYFSCRHSPVLAGRTASPPPCADPEESPHTREDHGPTRPAPSSSEMLLAGAVSPPSRLSR
jgi:hypothetical protein